MSLRFIYGKTGSGKTTLCLDEITRGKEDINYIYIVPEQFSLESEKALSSRPENEVRINKKVYSFSHLAKQMIAKYGCSGKMFDDTGKSMLLRKLAFDLKDDMVFYKNSFDKSGFLEKLSQTVTEFTRYGITADQLDEKISGEIHSKNYLDSVKYKLEDINKIYTAYCDYVSNALISEDTILDTLAGLIPNCDLLKGSYVWIDGFNGFTTQEMKVIREIMKTAEVVSVSLTLPYKRVERARVAAFDMYLATKNTYFDLVELAESANVPIKDSVFLNGDLRHKEDNDLAHLAKEYLNYKPKIYDKEIENIDLYAATDVENEINNLCYIIRKFVSVKGYNYSDIGVILGDTSYAPKVKISMRRYEIPCHIDERKKIISNRFARFVMSAVNTVAHDFNTVDVFSCLKTGMTDIAPDDIYIMENYVIENDVHGVYRWNMKSWEGGFYKNSGFDHDEINRIKNEITDILSPIIKVFKGGKKRTVKDISIAVYDMLEKNNVFSRLHETAEKYRDEKELEAADEYDKIWDIIKAVFEKMTELLGDQKVSAYEYSKILKSGIAASSMGAVPPAQDYVIVGDFERTRFSNIRALFFLGVSEGVVPPYRDDGGILPDSERAILEESGIKLSTDSLGKINRDKYLIYTCLCKPTERLIVSYAENTDDGGIHNPSSVIEKLNEIFPKLKTQAATTKANAPIPAFEEYVRNIERDNSQSAFWHGIEEYDNRLKRIARAIEDEVKTASLSRKVTSDIFKYGIYSSVSQLEAYGKCPFSFFLKYILKANARRNFEIDPIDLGNVYHAVIEQYLRDTTGEADWENINYTDIRKAVDSLTDGIVNDMANFNTSARLKQLTRRVKRRMSSSVWAAVEQIKAGNYVPAAFELEFGKQGGLPAIVFDTGNGIKMELTGKIDRVDICDSDGKSYVKIIDYKSGTHACNLSEIYAGIQLQLATYMSALTKAGKGFMGREKLEPGGMFYFKINDPVVNLKDLTKNKSVDDKKLESHISQGLYLSEKMDEMDKNTTKDGKYNGSIFKKEIAVSSEEFKNILCYVDEYIRQVGRDMIDGKMEIKPYKEGTGTNAVTGCDYCPYETVCRIGDKDKKGRYKVVRKMSRDEAMEKFKNAGEDEEEESEE